MDWKRAEETFESPVLGVNTLPRTFEDSVKRNSTRVAQRYKGGTYDRSLTASGVVPPAASGTYDDLTYEGMRDIVRRLAAGFRELGVRAGTRVSIFAHTRMEWAQADFGALAAGGIVTTVYPTSSRSQLAYLLGDAGAEVVVAENEALLERTLAVMERESVDVRYVVVIDEFDGHDDRDDVLTLGELHEMGDAAFDGSAYDSWLAERSPDDIASLIYTSGTTGRPKGVQLTHRNFRANVDQCYRRFGPRPDRDPELPVIDDDSTALSFLPLAHVFERLAGHYLMFAAGATVAYAESPDTLREDLGIVRPNVMTSVPRVYEKLYDAIREQAAESPIKRRIFEWATGVGREYQAADDPGTLLELRRALADRLVFSKVHEALGDRIEFFISGGGSLGAELCALYHGMGLPILEGYGLTETSPVISVNPPEDPRVGTIGPPVVDTDVRIDEDLVGADVRKGADGRVGELLVRGPQVCDGYWNKPDETQAAFHEDDQGHRWFRTGDIVELGDDDYITFRERAKQLLVLSTGKNVAPGPIEDAFASNEFVEQCVVVGDGQKFVSALIVPNFDRVRAWADDRGHDLPDDRRELCEDDRVHERINREVEHVNEEFEPHERIKQFRLVPEEFSEENDLLTPTMKKKRRNILDRFSDRIEMIYEEAG
ncbi:MAG: long-chain fatty acid--CoA ligase [Haloferacaceae archaeon]